MDEIQTPAGYFIAIGAVLLATLLMPPFPWLFLLVPVALFCSLLALLAIAFYTRLQRMRTKVTMLLPGPSSRKPV